MSVIESAINRYQQGDEPAALRLCGHILNKTPNDIDARILLALIHAKRGDHASAAQELNFSMRTQPRFEREGFSNAFGFSYAYLAEQLRQSAAQALAGSADGNRPLQELSLAVAEHVLGHLDEAEKRYRHCMMQGHDPYLSLMGLAVIRQQRGDDEGYRELIDYGAFPAMFDIAAEKGGEWTAQWNEALYETVIRHPSLEREIHPESPDAKYATGLFSREHVSGPLAELVELIEDKVELLREEITPVPGNPVLREIPSRYRTELFGALLHSGGYHSPHVHTASWLSGGYYARVPDLANDEDPKAGFLEFGKLLFPLADGFEGERHYLEPREGLLAFWPSHYIHNTVPCRDARSRLTMGFNIYPVD